MESSSSSFDEDDDSGAVGLALDIVGLLGAACTRNVELDVVVVVEYRDEIVVTKIITIVMRTG